MKYKNRSFAQIHIQDYDGLVYGVPSTGNAQGIVYNKKYLKPRHDWISKNSDGDIYRCFKSNQSI